MKTKIVNLPHNENGKREILDALLKSYSLTETFELNRNLYKHTVEARKHKDFDSNLAMKTLTISNEQDIAWEMFLLFSAGVKGSALYLATSLSVGIGTIASEFLSSLTISIGLKLGDTDIIEAMDGAEPVEQRIQNYADKCLIKINKNANEMKGKTHFTYLELVGYSKDLDQLVKTFGHSYYESLPSTQTYLADFVELESSQISEIQVSGGGASGESCCAIL